MYSLLVVDDEAVVRIGIKSCIDWEKIGIDYFFEASNGEEALQIITENKIDIMITDIKMAVMDGLKLLQEIEKFRKKPKVIIMSCYNDFENMRIAMQHNVKDFLFKPKMYPEDIAESVKRVIQEIRNDNNETKESPLCIEKIMKDILNMTVDNYCETFESIVSMLKNNFEISCSDAEKIAIAMINQLILIDNLEDKQLNLLSRIFFKNIYQIKACKSVAEIVDLLEQVFNSVKNDSAKSMRQDVINAVEFIEKNLTNPHLSLEMVAEHVHLSVSYFSRIFKSIVGCSFTDYIIDKRIELADKLYRTTDLKVYEIAERVGYPNTQYFSKLYKQRTGTNISRK